MNVDSILFWNPVNRLFSIHQVAFEAEFDGGPRFDFLQRISFPFKEASSIFPHLNKIQKKAALFYIYIEIHWILEREIFIFTLDNCSENYNIPWKIYCRSEVFFFMFQNICLVLPWYGLIARRVGVLEMKKKISWERLISVKFQTTFNHISTKKVIWKGSMFTFKVMSD